MATLAQIADRAGVGIGTVSRVLNGHPSVSVAMRARVETAMHDLGYSRPPRGGRPTRRGQVGVLVPFFDEPSAYERLRGIVSRLEPHALHVVLFNVSAPGQASELITSLVHDGQLDALIVISLPIGNDDARRLAAAPFPTVLLDTTSPLLASVGVDDRHGGQMATQHLLDLGHRRIGFVGEPPRNVFGSVASARREAGYEAALTLAGLTVDPAVVRHGAHLRSAARQMATDLLRLRRPPTGIVVASDVQCVGVIESAEQLGVAIPDALSVIGYDDIDLAGLLHITTVRQPLEESGRRVADLVVAAIQGAALAPFVEELELELVVRRTSGPLR